MNFYRFIKKNNSQIIKFIISGLIATLINFLTYSLIYIFFKKLVIASLFGYFLGLFFSFIFAKLWVFQDKSKQKVFKSFFIFCMIYFFGALVMSSIILILNYIFNNHTMAWCFGTFFAALNNFLGSKYLLFKNYN